MRGVDIRLGVGISSVEADKVTRWLGLHLVHLIGFRSRVVVLVNWTWTYLRWDRGNRVIVHESE